MPDITPADREGLHAAARSFNRKPARVVEGRQQRAGPGPRPGDTYNASATWQEVLGPAGWAVARRNGDTVYWRRPYSAGFGTNR